MSFLFQFREAVSIILSKWYPLSVASKAHFSGGENLTKWLVHDLGDEIIEYFQTVGNTFDFEEIATHLADVMDMDFNTALEETDADIPARELINAYTTLTEGNSLYLDQLRTQVKSLLVGLRPEDWIFYDENPEIAKNKPEDIDESSDEEIEEEMVQEQPAAKSEPKPKKAKESAPPDIFFEMRPKAPTADW